MFRSPLIQTVIQKAWFGNKLDSPAAVYPEYFQDGVPLAMIAFAATAACIRYYIVLLTCLPITTDWELHWWMAYWRVPSNFIHRQRIQKGVPEALQRPQRLEESQWKNKDFLAFCFPEGAVNLREVCHLYFFNSEAWWMIWREAAGISADMFGAEVSGVMTEEDFAAEDAYYEALGSGVWCTAASSKFCLTNYVTPRIFEILYLFSLFCNERVVEGYLLSLELIKARFIQKCYL